VHDTLKDIGDFLELAKENIDIRNKKINEDIKDLLLVMENL